ncbi:MAG: hypothetical protein PHG85_04315 [Candidatus Altiarchaeota archaeon]|nr:hypothetical protein [Candidatus Altiarchaeota archaeon]
MDDNETRAELEKKKKSDDNFKLVIKLLAFLVSSLFTLFVVAVISIGIDVKITLLLLIFGLTLLVLVRQVLRQLVQTHPIWTAREDFYLTYLSFSEIWRRYKLTTSKKDRFDAIKKLDESLGNMEFGVGPRLSFSFGSKHSQEDIEKLRKILEVLKKGALLLQTVTNSEKEDKIKNSFDMIAKFLYDQEVEEAYTKLPLLEALIERKESVDYINKILQESIQYCISKKQSLLTISISLIVSLVIYKVTGDFSHFLMAVPAFLLIFNELKKEKPRD